MLNLHSSLIPSGKTLVEYQNEYRYNCKRVAEVFITLHNSYYAGTSAYLWMGIKQGTIQCQTSKPTWNAPGYQGTYWKSATGCTNTFDHTKPIGIYLYSDSNNDVRVTQMGAKIGSTTKTWKSNGQYGYTAIDYDENNGWYTTAS